MLDLLQVAKPKGGELELSTPVSVAHGSVSKKQGFREFTLYIFDCHSYGMVSGSKCAVFQDRPDLLLE